MENIKEHLRRNIHRGEFELHSGVKTDYYMDIRPLFLNSLITHDVAILLLSHLNPDIHYIAGVEKSGFIIVPSIITACPSHYPLKGVLVRKIEKKHGLCRRIEGDFVPAKSKIAIVDDIITTGSTLKFATQAVQDFYNADVVQWLVLVDRTEGKFRTPIPMTYVFKIEEILAD